MCLPENATPVQEDDKGALLELMLSRLSDEELEIAARTSYAYLKNPSRHDQHECAMAMARRYLNSKKTVEKALDGMKRTIRWRKDMKLDQLRQTFDEQDGNPTALDKKQIQLRNELYERLSSKKSFVMGYDKQGRATFHFRPPLSVHHDLKWTMLESLYTMERAIACTQRQDNGTINAIVDIAGFQPMAHSPPIQVGQQFLQTLRKHYVGHFYKIIILDAPKAFVLLWKLLSPFVGTATRNKIVFLSGEKKKTEYLAQYYNPDQAVPWMMANGKKDRPLDMEEYLHKTPFDHAFDE